MHLSVCQHLRRGIILSNIRTRGPGVRQKLPPMVYVKINPPPKFCITYTCDQPSVLTLQGFPEPNLL